MKSTKLITVNIFALTMLITGAIDSMRNLPATALFGSHLIFFIVLAALLFLLPIGLISAWLSSSEISGGVYGWVKTAFGPQIAFLAIWLQWINTMIWYPTILSFIAGLIAYTIAPNLSQNPYYLVGTILFVYWGMTLVNLKGFHVSARFASICTVIGMVIPMVLLMGLGVLWVIKGHIAQISFHTKALIPSLHHSQNWVSLTAIMAAFLGMELATVHVKRIKNPQRIFPKALLLSITIILITMILGSLSIAVVLPQKNIHLVDGVMQVFAHFFKVYHLSWLTPVLAVMILIGSLGGMVNWMISPARGLLLAAQDHFLPKVFQAENKYGAPHVLLITQAVLVSLLCLTFLLMPSVNGSYWLLTDLSTNLYMLMYVLTFLAAIVLALTKQVKQAQFKLHHGKVGVLITSLIGLCGCLMTFIIGFFPPKNIAVGSFWHYESIFITGIITMIIPVIIFYRVRQDKMKTAAISAQHMAAQQLTNKELI
jgi:amino acid transporter